MDTGRITPMDPRYVRTFHDISFLIADTDLISTSGRVGDVECVENVECGEI